MELFRRRFGTPVWHWTPDCSMWPFPLQCEERERLPTGGELCNECSVKAPLGDADKPAPRRKR